MRHRNQPSRTQQAIAAMNEDRVANAAFDRGATHTAIALELLKACKDAKQVLDKWMATNPDHVASESRAAEILRQAIVKAEGVR